MSIGENIKFWRESRGLKQSELADLLEVSDKTISSWEINRTEPKMGMVEKISLALNCKKTDIIGTDEPTTVHYSKDIQLIIDVAERMNQFSLKRLQIYAKKLYELEQDEQLLNAAHARTDIEIPKGIDTSDDDIMDDENF